MKNRTDGKMDGRFPENLQEFTQALASGIHKGSVPHLPESGTPVKEGFSFQGEGLQEAVITVDSRGQILDVSPGFIEDSLCIKGASSRKWTKRSFFELELLESIARHLPSQLVYTSSEKHHELVLPERFQQIGSRFCCLDFRNSILLGKDRNCPVQVRALYLLQGKNQGEVEQLVLFLSPVNPQEFVEDELGFLREEYDRFLRRYKDANEEFLVLKSMKSDFMSLTSHELLTPLQIIMGNLDILHAQTECDGDLRKQERLDVIIRNTSRIYDLTRRMYDLSRVRVNPLTLQKQQQKVLPVLKEIILDFSVLFTEHDLQLDDQLPDNLPEIPLDRQKFWQACSEIFDYCIHYSKPQETIVVSAEASELDIRILIRKLGSGLSRKHRQFLFETFYEPHNILNHKEGTGLGLAIAKKYVDAHGGEIQVESDSEEGLSFLISLPRKVPLEQSIEWKMLKAGRMSGSFSD